MKVVTIKRTFTRDDLLTNGGKVKGQQTNSISVGTTLVQRLLRAGIPVIGHFGVIAVEWGTLTMKHEDGLDGDEWAITWTGEAIPAGWPKEQNGSMVGLTIDKPLAAQIAAEDEL